jgi:septum formation protein
MRKIAWCGRIVGKIMKPNAPFILASGSAIRRKMLADAGLDCTVVKPEVDEEALRATNAHLPIPEQALLLARAKGAEVAVSHPHAYVLAADQICALGDDILCKPMTHENAVKQLLRMQGKTHQQHSAAVLFYQGKEIWSAVETATLTMRPLSEQEIDAYLLADKPYHACGSYHYEAGGRALFSEVQGIDDVIYGLPMQQLLKFLSLV